MLSKELFTDFPSELEVGATGGGFSREENGDLRVVTLPTIYTTFNGVEVSEGDKIVDGKLVKKEN